MKKLISISLVLVLAGGLLLAGNTKAEAMNNESAALLAASIFLGPPLIWAMTHDRYVPAPVYGGGYYDDSYPVQTRVVYRAPLYERHYGQYWGRGYGHERGRQEQRGHREYQRDREHDRGRYSNRY